MFNDYYTYEGKYKWKAMGITGVGFLAGIGVSIGVAALSLPADIRTAIIIHWYMMTQQDIGQA